MPYKSDSIKIAGTQYDSRIKLTQDAREAIAILREHGFSQRQLADLFNVSRRLIQVVLNPQAKQSVKQSISSSTTPKTTEYWTEAKRKSRAKKQELMKSGKINTKRA